VKFNGVERSGTGYLVSVVGIGKAMRYEQWNSWTCKKRWIWKVGEVV